MRLNVNALMILLLCAFAASTCTSAQDSGMLPVEGRLPSLDGATQWLNSPPLNSADLRGKVVLFDFWTYTCINWRRTMPWLRLWEEKYRAHGLVVVGVHTPEFSFEADIVNVRREAAKQDVSYPVAVDSDHAIWNAFGNQYWPALYFVDAQGRIRHHQFGEGDYGKLEGVIQQLLVEAGSSSFDRQFVSADGRGPEAEADWENLRSPEAYLGSARSERPTTARDANLPERLSLNAWALAGDWTVKSEFSALKTAPGKVGYQFHARDVHLVMGPGATGKAIRFRVLIDGKPPGPAHGVDVDAEGFGSVDQPRMYHLIRQSAPIADRRLEIEFLAPGVRLFSFTFG